MTDLVAFLRARLDEDEAQAKLIRSQLAKTEATLTFSVYELVPEGQLRRDVGVYDPARVLREVEAKRRIIEWCETEGRWYMGPVLYLASAYSDHPDYREEWRP